MPSNTLVLSGDTSYGLLVLSWLGRYGSASRVVTDWAVARDLVAHGDAPVVIFDADRPIADAGRVLNECAAAACQVIVLAHGLDSRHWLQYIEAGAFDVLVTPVDPAHLRAAVGAAVRAEGVQSSSRRSWSAGLWQRLIG